MAGLGEAQDSMTYWSILTNGSFVRMGRMLREGSARGEDIPWYPPHKCDGDLGDTGAVKARNL